jgi:F0F1-type ATP synthase assembly protein I
LFATHIAPCLKYGCFPAEISPTNRAQRRSVLEITAFPNDHRGSRPKDSLSCSGREHPVCGKRRVANHRRLPDTIAWLDSRRPAGRRVQCFRFRSGWQEVSMVDDPASRRHRRISSIAQAYRDSHEVMSAALSVAIFAGGGYWLDSKYGYKPLLTICGLLIGCVFAIESLRRLLVRLDKRTQRQKESLSIKGAPKE